MAETARFCTCYASFLNCLFFPFAQETQRLEYHNTSLRSEIKQLHEEREQLARIIQNHASVCPLTPRHSPLTIPNHSPASIRASPVTQPSPCSSSRTMTTSPAPGKGSELTPVLLAPPARDSPVPLLIINSEGDAPANTSVVISSPAPVTGRPRKSPVSLLPSPGHGDKIGERSPIPCGSPAKQSKHSVPPHLSLIGPKPITPTLSKSTNSAFPASPSPRTPKCTITSPLPIAPGPVSSSRAVHASPVFFSEGGFPPSSHSQHTNHSPLSASCSSSGSTPARIAQQSPVFFGDRAPRSADAGCNFLQPVSTSSGSSTSSLASLLRQESPLSVLSNSSGISNASSVFVASNTNLNTCFSGIAENPGLVSNNDNSNVFNSVHNFPDCPQSVYSSSSQSSFPENPEDNVLSLEEIEKSASGFETRDDLLDFMDIQALLELSADHNGNDIESSVVQSDDAIECHMTSPHGSNARHNDIENGNDISVSAGCLDINSEARHANQIIPPTSQQANQGLFSTLFSQDVNTAPSTDTGQSSNLMDNSETSSQRGTSLAADHNSCHTWNLPAQRRCEHHTGCGNADQDQPCRNSSNNSGLGVLQRRGEPAQEHTPFAGNLHQIHNLLREIIHAQNGHIESAEANMIRSFLLSRFARELDPELTNNDDRNQDSSDLNNHQHVPKLGSDTDRNTPACDQDLVNSQNTFPVDTMFTSRGVHDNRPENVLSHKSHQST